MYTTIVDEAGDEIQISAGKEIVQVTVAIGGKQPATAGLKESDVDQLIAALQFHKSQLAGYK